MTDLTELARMVARRSALTEQIERAIVAAMNAPDRNVTEIARAAGMTRAGVHKLHQRLTKDQT